MRGPERSCKHEHQERPSFMTLFAGSCIYVMILMSKMFPSEEKSRASKVEKPHASEQRVGY